MKRLFFVLVTVFFNLIILAQAPQKMSYQAVIRDGDDNLVTTQIGMQISILQGEIDGTVVYSESQTPIPNINGLVTIEIGDGNPTAFEAIDWSDGPYYIKTEIATEAPLTTYTITGTSQILSVPYALHATTASVYPETDPEVGVNTENYLSKWDGAALVQSSVFDNGKIGIGTNDPEENLHIVTTTTDGNINLEVPDGDGYYLGYNSTGDYMAISVVNSGTAYWETLNLKSGNVGVGTTNPSTKLDVNGIVKATGADFTGTTTVPAPVNPTDATTKEYVDALLQKIDQLENQPGVLKDVEGNLYTTIKIGTQVWMAENLRTTRYKDGTEIPLVTDNTAWSNLTTPGYCWYNNDMAVNKDTYGAMYNWYTVNSGDLCPAGWHVPSDEEWTTLENYLTDNGYNYDGTTSGNKIAKAMASTILWTSSTNTGAVGNTDYPDKRNATGFTALPGGNRHSSGSFSDIGNVCYWWSATGYDATDSWFRLLGYHINYLYIGHIDKRFGSSVRCLRD